MAQDKIYVQPLKNIGDFVFDDNVAEVFTDMIKRSIPGYANILTTIGMLATRFVCANSNVYDLGCALGAATLAVSKNITKQEGIQIIAVDNSSAMIKKTEKKLRTFNLNTDINLQCADICNIEIKEASMVILNFTLQFIEPSKRITLLKNIFAGMKHGGILVLSEKYDYKDKTINGLMFDLHYDFKKANNYSELEISQKRSALETVMRTDTIETHIQRLKEAGFKQITPWYQCFNFGSILAIKA